MRVPTIRTLSELPDALSRIDLVRGVRPPSPGGFGETGR
jgi:hypothetical protein